MYVWVGSFCSTWKQHDIHFSTGKKYWKKLYHAVIVWENILLLLFLKCGNQQVECNDATKILYRQPFLICHRRIFRAQSGFCYLVSQTWLQQRSRLELYCMKTKTDRHFCYYNIIYLIYCVSVLLKYAEQNTCFLYYNIIFAIILEVFII